MSLSVYTASAGAGKTHTLTREYLRLALSSTDPRYFTSIQAVTFTKKATEEMKERITAELHQLAQDPQQSRFSTELMQALGLSRGKLQERAKQTLRAMLLDYDAFRVRTIDSFFQEVVRAFAHELGHSGVLRVELATSPYYQRAVQGVLAAQDEQGASPVIRDKIELLLLEAASEGKKLHALERDLGKFAGELEEEAVKLLRADHRFPSREAVEALRKAAVQERDTILQQIRTLVNSLAKLLDSHALEDVHFSHGKSGALSPFWKLREHPDVFIANQKLVTEASRFKKYMDSSDPSEGLFSKTGKESAGAELASIAQAVKSHMSDLRDHIERDYPRLSTALQVLKCVELYGLLIDIDAELQRLKQEEGVMFLSDAPSLISSLLRDSQTDTPFLYEKIGVRISHHMIDEFQDTSRMQYQNFLPLLANSLAEGKDCLVVGDAKQSIYRFRNSDSSLLTTQLAEDFHEHIDPQVLKENWRSAREIIHFNNALFSDLPGLLSDLFNQEWGAQNNAVRGLDQLKAALDDFLKQQLKAYEDVTQEVPQLKTGAPAGQVVVHRYSRPASQGSHKQEEEEASQESDQAIYAQLPQVIIDLQKRGYKASDIAILVRSKVVAEAVAKLLRDFPEAEREGYSLHFVSQEALVVGSSLAVRFLIALLSYIAEPNQASRQLILAEHYTQLQKQQRADEESSAFVPLSEELLQELQSIGRRGLYEATEGLIHRFSDLFSQEEGAYIVKFLDLLYSKEREGALDIETFLTYWREEGCKQNIVSAPSEDALQLMTIHKSKGLGFPVVLLPDLTWQINPGRNSWEKILWCDLPDLPEVQSLRAAGVGCVPLRLQADLGRSFFAQSYYEEVLRNRIDEANLLYVAMTRPQQELHLWLAEEQGGGDKLDSAEALVQRHLRGERAKAPFIDIPVGEEWEPEAPLQAPPRKPAPKQDVWEIPALESYPIGDRLAVLHEGLDFFTEGRQLRYGWMMHQILSQVEREEELEDAVAEAVRQGYVGQEQAEELAASLRQIITKPEARRWFDGSGTVYNEQAIIGGGLAISRRPDRVILYPDGRVEVVDYKFGQASHRYFSQVRRYMRLLLQMGYSDVRGYLCYLQEDGVEVVPVSLGD